MVRGVYVMERILGITPTPPPPNIPGVEPDIRGTATLRELLDKHLERRQLCFLSQPHRPARVRAGELRRHRPARDRFAIAAPKANAVNVAPVRAAKCSTASAQKVGFSSGKFLDGSAYTDFHAYRDYLAKHDDRLARAFAGKLLTFATGRELGFSDRAELDRIVADTAQNKHRLATFFIVLSNR